MMNRKVGISVYTERNYILIDDINATDVSLGRELIKSILFSQYFSHGF